MLDRPLASYYLLLASAGLLLIIGLTMVFSATSITSFVETRSAYGDVIQQFGAAVVGLIAFWICQRLPRRTFRGLARLALGTSIGLLAILDLINLLAGSSKINAPKLGPFVAHELWLNVGPVQLQPSELAKFALVIWGADVLVRKGEQIGRLRELATPLFPVVGLLFVLVGYNDLGTMLTILIIFVSMLWVAGVRFRVFGTMILVALAGVAALVMAPGKGYRFGRLTAFLHPELCNQMEECYQITQGKLALLDGGWFGAGLGQSVFKWGRLPENRNDFIFAIIAEELGVVGCVMVLVLFGVLGYTGLRIASRVPDPFRRIAATAVTLWLLGQALINIGGVVGLLPVTGLVLPFISYGGSALVVSMGAVGMLASFARAEPEAARALHARPPARWVRLLWAPLPALSARFRPADSAVPADASTAPGERRTGRPAAPAARRRSGDGQRRAGRGRGETVDSDR
ncbi:FtsW/RodA/SpoVE family cell cycle protein [Allocatelliglobosispora scoriae]|nr:putative peptidoglycan glycosyltransferase FtsW [Allocatelliglobosispora scoriae]